MNKKYKEEAQKKSCSGCKFLDYYNNGKPFCKEGVDHTCIRNGFMFKEVKK